MVNIFITGANKGLGAGFVKEYLGRSNTVVVAGVRNPSAKDSQALNDLKKGENSKLILVKIESTSDTDAAEAVKTIQAQGVTHLDIVIANAAIFKLSAFVSVAETTPSDLIEHFDVNTTGPLRLFRATLPLLQAAEKPKFVAISSAVGTIVGALELPISITAYGVSKAGLNYLVRRIHAENEKLVSLALHPGSVQTESGNEACQKFGLPEAPDTLESSVNGLVSKIDSATRETTSGQFLSFDDTPLTW